MFERLNRHGKRLAEWRVHDRRERIAAGLSDIPGVTTSVEGEAVMLSGRRLGRRYDGSAGLRWQIAEVCDER
jgi:hypothetical protein